MFISDRNGKIKQMFISGVKRSATSNVKILWLEHGETQCNI